MLGALREAGWDLETDPACADAIVVNTCGFIRAARKESLEAIRSAVRIKSDGRCRSVAAVGCLPQRFAKELRRQVPELDAVMGVGRVRDLPNVLDRTMRGEKVEDDSPPPTKWTECGQRVVSTPPWTAYLKIADGCDNRCAYCVIPDIRGPFRSRPKKFIIAEAERLVAGGVKELVLVAQDSTRYGLDIGDGDSLPGLLRELSRVSGICWIRIMYAYPTRITDELIEVITAEEAICKYLDVPMQHGDAGVLKRMRREGAPEQYLERVAALRRACPDIALRTTFIVGFPGETDAEFDTLLDFVRQVRFDRLGAFVYSREEGTPAAEMRPIVKRRVAEERFARLMELQQSISLRRNQAFVGRELDVLVEGRDDGGLFGRSYRDAPEIDGTVRLPDGTASPGEFVRCRIARGEEYDLIAEGPSVRTCCIRPTAVAP